MEEKLFPNQSIDLPQTNPIKPVVNPKEKIDFRLRLQQLIKTKDPKIKALIILGLILFILIILSLVTTVIRQTKNQTIDIPQVTPTPYATPTPINDANIIPEAYQPQYRSIQTNLNTNLEFLPPEIDTDIGL